jgi:phytanoyl-CoA hydroxylase
MKQEDVVREYREQGFVHLPKFYSSEKLAQIRAALERYNREVVPGLPESDVVYEADGQAIRNCWRMHTHDPFFAELHQDERLQTLIAELVNGTPLCLGVETFNKPAKVGSGVPPHQDNAYFCQEPPDVLTVWVAMDDVTPENGPVHYLSGSHLRGLREHTPSGVKGNSFGLAEAVDEESASAALLKQGDILIHHCQTIHFSAPNISDHPRLGLLLVVRGAHTEDSPEMKDAYHRARALMESSPS